MIKILPINETKVRIQTDLGTLQEIADSFKFRVDGYKHMPSYKMGFFDGYIRLVDLRFGTIPKGLIPDLLRWSNERDYEIEVDESIVKPFKERIEFSWQDLQLGFGPRDYQEDAVTRCLAKKRQIILASTGAGKSLIIYANIRALETVCERKILLIVPSISLVDQMYGDFKDYSKNDADWDVSCVHKIYGGEEKQTRKHIVISTWQSLQNIKDDEYFQQFDAVLFDEVHTCVGKVVASIMDKCTNAFYRFGFTGTLSESKTNEMQLKALFGPVHRVTNTKDLMDRGLLADLKIKVIILKYFSEYLTDMANAKGFTYKQEMDLLCMQDTRNNFISKLVATRQNNTLVLFQFVEKHGKPLERKLRFYCEGKQIHLVYGGTEAEQRERVRQICETHNNVVILASYGVYQQGINIKNLHNIVFASPTKSKIRVLQSIGRGLRTHESKESCNLYDIGDDLRGNRKKPNFTLNHLLERAKMYQQEGFDVEFITKEV